MNRIRRLVLPTLLAAAAYWAVFGGEYSVFELSALRAATVEEEYDWLPAVLGEIERRPVELLGCGGQRRQWVPDVEGELDGRERDEDGRRTPGRHDEQEAFHPPSAMRSRKASDSWYTAMAYKGLRL